MGIGIERISKQQFHIISLVHFTGPNIYTNNDAVPGASIAVQTYGDFLNFNPHLHAIISDSFFSQDGYFHMAPGFILEDLEEIFQYEVLKTLKKEGQITDTVIKNMLSWRHSGFHVYIGDRIFSDEQADLGRGHISGS